MKLTQKTVETALYEGRSHMSKGGRKRWSQHVLWDEGLPGFGLRITPTNRKSFIVSYRSGGRKRTKTLGRAGRLKLDEARRQATELLDSVAEKHPRTAARPTKLEGVETVAQLADAYLEGHLKGNVPSWFADQRLIRMHIKPALGRSPIAEVTQTDLANLGARVARRFPADARRLRPLLDGMFDWAAEHGLWSKSSPRPDGPAAPHPAEEGPEPAPLPPAQELMASLQESEARRQELTAHLEEVSSSGVEMLSKLNEQAAALKELEAELQAGRRGLEQAKLEAKNRPDSAKTTKQIANLQQSVEQLMSSLEEAESDRRELADKVAVAEASAGEQAKKVAALIRSRNELERRILEEERQAAIRKVQRVEGGSGRRLALWLVVGAIGGALLTLAVQRSIGPPSVATQSRAAAQAVVAVVGTELAAADQTAFEGEATAEAAPPAREAAPGGPASDEHEPDLTAVESAVRSWAAAWSEQRIDDYLAAYSERFAPAGELGRREWAAQRRDRVLRPASIRVTVQDLRQTMADTDRVRVTFEQSYETESFADQVSKTLELIWEGGGWKIVAEKAG